jgi:hypothetical protein
MRLCRAMKNTNGYGLINNSEAGNILRNLQELSRKNRFNSGVVPCLTSRTAEILLFRPSTSPQIELTAACIHREANHTGTRTHSIRVGAAPLLSLQHALLLYSNPQIFLEKLIPPRISPPTDADGRHKRRGGAGEEPAV